MLEPNLHMLWRNGSQVRMVPAKRQQFAAPTIVLMNPKYPHNVGAVLRAAACYDTSNVIYTGDRVSMVENEMVKRIPREERMRDYAGINLIQYDRPFDLLPPGAQCVAVEVRENAEDLVHFEHPRDAVYVFGPEDGSLGKVPLRLCQRFVRIPTTHCLNLSVAVATVLYDRLAKEVKSNE